MDYWDQQEASVNGVLGGYGHLSTADVRDSRAFLRKVGDGVGKWSLQGATGRALGALAQKIRVAQECC